MSRDYQDFLLLLQHRTTAPTREWLAKDSLGAYFALRADAEAIGMGQPPVLGLTYIRRRRAPGGVEIAGEPDASVEHSSGLIGVMLSELALARAETDGEFDAERAAVMVANDPLLRATREGDPVDLRMSAASVLPMLRGAMRSPARELNPDAVNAPDLPADIVPEGM